MMRFSVYVRVEGGVGFDLDAFAERLPPDFRGEIMSRPYLRGRESDPARRYWRSVPVRAEQSPEDVLQGLLQRLESVLTQEKRRSGLKVSAQIVHYYRAAETPVGFFLSGEFVRLLAALEADIDIDAVDDLE